MHTRRQKQHPISSARHLQYVIKKKAPHCPPLVELKAGIPVESLIKTVD
jgi:hypothetical protein